VKLKPVKGVGTNNFAQEQKNKKMAKQYKGSLSLEWFNKQKAIVQLDENSIKSENDIPAPRINWINKEEALFYELNLEEGKGNTPYWVNRDDIRVKEARPLVFQKAFKAVEKDKKGTIPGTDKEFVVEEITKEEDALDIENMLIKGDNLLALNTLKKHFDKLPDSEKVKCIYIDPPYNTEQSFDLYEDNFELSEWLTMMRDRINIFKSLLRHDGTFIIQLDDKMIHHCKLVCDEIFGSDNFINMIAYERSGTAGIGQGSFFVDTCEYILVYANDKGQVNFNEVFDSELLEQNVMKRYNKILKHEGEKSLIKEFNSKSNGKPVRLFKHDNYLIESISLKDFEKRESEIRREYFDDFDKIFRTTNPQQENSFQQELIASMNKGLYSVEYTPSRGKYKDAETTLHYLDSGIFAWLKDTAIVENGEVVKQNKLSTVWKHGEIPKADLANEGGVEMKRSKKPEQLLYRIIELLTDEGDIVLDSFLGSGTTAAVAHKMKRKWIGIEIGNHADTHVIPRLNGVLSSIDQSGISKNVNWQGGGSFKYYHLGESIINVDKETGKGEFNWSLGKQFIQGSLLVSYDFVVQKDIDVFPAQIFKDNSAPTVGKLLGKNNKSIYGLSFLVAPDEKEVTISNEEIKSIYNVLRKQTDFHSLVIYTNKGIDIAQDAMPDDMDIIKVPHAIFAELER